MHARPICVLSFVYASAGAACEAPAGPESLANEITLAPPKPILEGYTADPHAVVFDDTYYVYPTSDKPGWQTTDFSVWSSKDLIHWHNEGIVLDVTTDLRWAKIRAWPSSSTRFVRAVAP